MTYDANEGSMSNAQVLATFRDNDPYASSFLNPKGSHGHVPTFDVIINWGDGGVAIRIPT